MKRLTRKTLYTSGRHGDSVRVLVDKRRGRVVVQYRDADGVARKKFYEDTPEAREEAIAWGSAYHAERERLAAEALRPSPRPRLRVRDLWEKFVASPQWSDLRPRTRVAYQQRWARWELSVGRESYVDDTTLAHVDDFMQSARSAGVAINQVRQVINVARLVYNWGSSRKHVTTNELALYRWKKPKDAVVHEPGEYSDAEFVKLLGVLSPQDGRTWRPWVALMLAGHHGQRANAVLHLRWEDIDEPAGLILWPAQYQKTGVALEQPLTWEALSALRTAWEWRTRTGYMGPWVLFAGGGNKSMGPALVGNARHYRKDRTADQDTAYTYQALHLALTKAEQRSGVTHEQYRAVHGFRRMAAGNVADGTGDDRLGMEWIGDKDMKQAKSYLKRRSSRIDRAADAVSRLTNRPESVPEMSLTQNAAPDNGVEGESE